ncbi:MAG: DUF4983 domain-containing protein [Niabella sp.]
MKKIRKYSLAMVAILVVLMSGTITSCKKYADPPPYFEQDDSTSAAVGKRKVLLIGIDGLPGKEFTALNLPTMTAMLDKSKFSLDNMAETEVTTDASGWKTLLSGVSYSNHQIKDSTFESDAEPEEGEVGKNYPSLFYFVIRSARPDLQSRFVSSWPQMLSQLTPEVSYKIATGNDAATKDSVVAALGAKNDDILVAHFSGLNTAGKAGAFSASNAGFKAAALQIDTYIGEIMTALKARPGYNKEEDWLVIISGTHGGKNNSYGGASSEETEVPAIYYNEKFHRAQFTRQGAMSAVEIKGNFKYGYVRAVADDAPAFNPGTGQFTLEMSINGTKAQVVYPHFLSKVTGWTDNKSQRGWTYYTSTSGGWSVRIGGSGGSKQYQDVSDVVFDNTWHKLTMVIYDTVISGATKRYFKRFIDGRRATPDASANYDISSVGDITNSLPIILGYGGDDGYWGGSDQKDTPLMPFYMSDLTFFNTALTDEEVKSNVCLTDISKHPKYANVTAYFPGNDGLGGKFINRANAAQSLNIQGNFSWTPLNKFPCSFVANPPQGQITNVTTNTDVATILFYWLKINTSPTWGLQGNNWLSPYENEFVEVK